MWSYHCSLDLPFLSVSLTINHIILTLFHLLSCLSSGISNHKGMTKRFDECMLLIWCCLMLRLARDCGQWEKSICQSHSMHFFLKKTPKNNPNSCASHIYWFLLESFNMFCLQCLYYCMSDCVALLTMHLCPVPYAGDKCICIYFCEVSGQDKLLWAVQTWSF